MQPCFLYRLSLSTFQRVFSLKHDSRVFSVRVASFDKSAYRIAPSADCREQQIYTITGYWNVIEVSLVRCLRNKLSFDRNRSKYNKLLVKHNSTDCGVTYCRNSIYHKTPHFQVSSKFFVEGFLAARLNLTIFTTT